MRDTLKHYGVPGMKWGSRGGTQATTQVDPEKNRQAVARSGGGGRQATTVITPKSQRSTRLIAPVSTKTPSMVMQEVRPEVETWAVAYIKYATTT